MGRRMFARPGVAVAGLLLLAGCGSRLPATVPVTGTVTHGGEPVEGARVVFSRGGGGLAAGELAIGTTDAAGRFALRTHFGGQADAAGAVPGAYAVTVSKHVLPPGVTPEKYRALVEAATAAGERGEMVPKGKEPPPLVEMFPPHYARADRTRLTAAVAPGGANDFPFRLER